MERVIACLIHHVAYVENLYPFLQSNLSTALIRPRFPSCIRSRNSIPLPTYLLAMLTTSLRLASQSFFFASSSPFSIFLASSISSSAESRGTLPISLRYILTGSSTVIPLGSEASRSTFPSSITISSSCSRSSTSRLRSSASSGSISVSSFLISISDSISIPMFIIFSYTSSIKSLSISRFPIISEISP